MAEKWENILIIKPSALGDIVHTLPALSSLRRSFPDAKISWLVRPEFAQLIENHPDLNRVIIFDRKLLSKWWRNKESFRAFKSLVKDLRQSKFDLVIDFQGLFRTAIFARLSGCKNRFGYSTAREFATIFYTSKIDRDENNIHVVDYSQKVIAATGATELDVKFKLRVTGEAITRIDELLTRKKVEKDNYTVFVPGSANDLKCWSVENFAALADKISDKFDMSVVLSGTKSEEPGIKKIISKAKTKVANFAGRTDLMELATLLKGARLVVSNDTGPGHIAAAFGKPMVIIFGPSNPARVFPYGRATTVAAIDPFSRNPKMRTKDPSHKIEDVSIDCVFEKVCEQLQQSIEVEYVEE